MPKPQNNEIRLMVDELKSQLKGLGEGMGRMLGQSGEPVPNKKQMAAFDAMTTEDWIKMAEEKGFLGAKSFYDEMTRRKAIAEAQRRPEGV